MAEPTIEQDGMDAPATDAPVTDAPRADADAPHTATVRLQLTPSALEEIRGMLADAGVEEEGGLRLTARTGAGCSAPLQYGMFLEEGPEDDDVVLTADDVRIFLTPEDAWALDGLMVDYVSSAHLGEGFAFRHPNGPAGRSC